jgi:hypothetical protein
LTSSKVEELLHLDTCGRDRCDATRALAEHRRADLHVWIRDLQRMHDSLANLVDLRPAPRRSQLRAAGSARPPPGDDPMNLEVLHGPDCPNLTPLLERLVEVTDLPVATRVIETDADAAAFGMAGSPTLLIDGVDPFTTPGQCECGVSCRLYRDQDGRIVPAPSVEQLRAAITAAGQPSSATEVPSARPATGPGREGGAPGDPAPLRHHL